MLCNRRKLIGALVILCLVFTSCGDLRGERVTSGLSTGSGAVQRESAVAQWAPTDAIAVSHLAQSDAFEFSAVELTSGRALVGSDLVGDGPVVITFIVPRCPICVSEGPELGASAAGNPDITYVLVHSGGTGEAYENYVSSAGLTSSNVVHLDDSPGLLWARFGVVQQPTTVLIDVDGKVSQSLGALGRDGLANAISELRGT